MLTIEFTVEIDPIGKGRPKFKRIGNYVQTYTPKKTADYEKLIRDSAKAYMDMNAYEPLETPVEASIRFYMHIPKSASKKMKASMSVNEVKHISKPDVDNLAKAVLDAINKVCFCDDSQVVNLSVSKQYSELPRIEIKICESLI